MNSLKLLIPYLTAACIFSLPGFSQEPSANEDDVNRILSELNAEADSSSDEASMTDFADAESESLNNGEEESMSGNMEDTPSDSTDSDASGTASDVPAISLEEAMDVEGMSITSNNEDITEGLITVNLSEAPLEKVITIFARASGANIIIPEGLDQPVSANLYDVFWRDALDVILADKGYALIERSSGIFTINLLADIAAEPLATDTIELQYITAEAALPAVQSMIISSNARVTPIPQTNVLIVNETAQQLQEIKRLVKLVDKPRSQVFIEAKFVELNDSAIKDLGINWSVLQNYSVSASNLVNTYTRTDNQVDQNASAFTASGGRVFSDTGTRSSDITVPGVITGTDTTTTTFSNSERNDVITGQNIEEITDDGITFIPRMEREIVRTATLSAEEFGLTLSALQQLDGVRVVSNPKMLVANGQTANIHVGRNEPNVRAIPQGENANTFAYVLDGFIEIGVKLEVTPIINTSKNITINIIPELSRLLGEKTVGEAGTTFPITQIRRIETEFAVESGKTVAIGGLTQSDENEEVTKVPLLGDLPIIGKYLFTHTSTRMIQDEIIIFVSVDTAHTEKLNDRDGIPNEGALIHTWLEYQDRDEQAPLRSTRAQ